MDQIFAKLMELEPLIRKLEDLGTVKVIEEKVVRLDEQLEKVKREQVATNVIIVGVMETKDETFAELEQQVEKVFGALNIGDIDYGRIRRLGRPSENKPRIIQAKLVRELDKVKILRAKKTLRGIKDLENVYINPELTPLQQQREMKLREVAKTKKKGNPKSKYHIRGGRLIVTSNKGTEEYGVNAEGNVQEIK